MYHPASEDNAASENPSNPQIPATPTTSHTAWTGVCVCLLIRHQYREPRSAPSLAKAKTTREASTDCAAQVTNYKVHLRKENKKTPQNNELKPEQQ